MTWIGNPAQKVRPLRRHIAHKYVVLIDTRYNCTVFLLIGWLKDALRKQETHFWNPFTHFSAHSFNPKLWPRSLNDEKQVKR